jgi:hypothetical protein
VFLEIMGPGIPVFTTIKGPALHGYSFSSLPSQSPL